MVSLNIRSTSALRSYQRPLRCRRAPPSESPLTPGRPPHRGHCAGRPGRRPRRARLRPSPCRACPRPPWRPPPNMPSESPPRPPAHCAAGASRPARRAAGTSVGTRPTPSPGARPGGRPGVGRPGVCRSPLRSTAAPASQGRPPSPPPLAPCPHPSPRAGAVSPGRAGCTSQPGPGFFEPPGSLVRATASSSCRRTAALWQAACASGRPRPSSPATTAARDCVGAVLRDVGPARCPPRPRSPRDRARRDRGRVARALPVPAGRSARCTAPRSPSARRGAPHRRSTASKVGRQRRRRRRPARLCRRPLARRRPGRPEFAPLAEFALNDSESVSRPRPGLATRRSPRQPMWGRTVSIRARPSRPARRT